MEKSLSLLDEISQSFDCEIPSINTYSPQALAFLGDCVFEIIIRSVMVGRGNKRSDSLHKSKSQIVNARVQAQMIEALEPELTEEEAAWYRRGRNTKTHSSAKNATVGQYKKATGLETMYGYLYLTGQQARMMELTKRGLELVDIIV